MIIRKAKLQDVERLSELLYEVHNLHAKMRPDIFKPGCQKYTANQLPSIIENQNTPIFVAEDKKLVVGYIFGIIEEVKDHQSLEDLKTMYIDDLCVDKEYRGKHIATSLYNHMKIVAKSLGCTRMTLNVWTLNEDAMPFYEKLGLKPLKITMEDKF